MKKLLAVDDDEITLSLLETVIPQEKFVLNTFSNAEDALKSIVNNHYDLIISDLFMPIIDGREFYRKVRKLNPEIPFIFLTSNDDIDTIIKLLKLGADNYLKKPFNQQKLISILENTLTDKNRELLINKIQIDEITEDVQNQGIFSWKNLYGSKDSEQSKQMIEFLTRNINQAGGFVWLDMLKDKVNSSADPENINLSRSFLDMIIESAGYINQLLNNITKLNSLINDELATEKISVVGFIEECRSVYEIEMIPLAANYKKRISINITNKIINDFVIIDKETLKRCCKELLYNAIKFSPLLSRILIFIDINQNKNKKYLEISFWNYPIETNLRNKKGDKVAGIPYEFSESIFDLFFTFEKFPTEIPEEEWNHGMGLYLVRKLLQKMNAEINAKNVLMHMPDKTVPYVKVSILIPILEE